MAKPTISGYCFDYYACFGRSLHFDYIRKKELQTAYKAIKRVDTKIEKQRGKTMPYLIKAEQKFPYYYAKTGEFFSSKNSATRIPTLEKAQDYLEEVKLLCPNCKAQIVEFEDKKYNETPEQRQKRLESNKKSKMKMLANETPEQREKRLERQRQANKRQVARETPEQRKERLERSRQYQRNKLANETPEQREKRLEKRRQHDFTRRQNNV